MRIVSQLIREIARIGARAHHRDDAVVEISVQMIDEVLARVVRRGERRAFQIADMSVQQDDPGHQCFAGQIDPHGAARELDLAPPADSRDGVVLDEHGGVVDWRAAIASDQPCALEQRTACRASLSSRRVRVADHVGRREKTSKRDETKSHEGSRHFHRPMAKPPRNPGSR